MERDYRCCVRQIYCVNVREKCGGAYLLRCRIPGRQDRVWRFVPGEERLFGGRHREKKLLLNPACAAFLERAVLSFEKERNKVFSEMYSCVSFDPVGVRVYLSRLVDPRLGRYRTEKNPDACLYDLWVEDVTHKRFFHSSMADLCEILDLLPIPKKCPQYGLFKHPDAHSLCRHPLYRWASAGGDGQLMRQMEFLYGEEEKPLGGRIRLLRAERAGERPFVLNATAEVSRVLKQSGYSFRRRPVWKPEAGLTHTRFSVDPYRMVAEDAAPVMSELTEWAAFCRAFGDRGAKHRKCKGRRR